MSECRIAIAGCPFVITPAERLSDAERVALHRFEADADGRALLVRLSGDVPRLTDAPHDGEPAAITVEGDRVFVAHERFAGTIDPSGFEATLARQDEQGSFALEILLRTALSCRLPLEGGLLLHSAGIVIGESAAIFFGESGAGKTTIAELLGGLVLSDELVAVQDGKASSTGFWGTLDREDAPRGAFPIRALVDLDRADGVQIERLEPRDAFRRLLLATVVPPHPLLWTQALRVVERLSHAEVHRLRWSPSEANARRVVQSLWR